MKDNGARWKGTLGPRERSRDFKETIKGGQSTRRGGRGLGESEVAFSHLEGQGTTSWTGLMGIPCQLLQPDGRAMPVPGGSCGAW